MQSFHGRGILPAMLLVSCYGALAADTVSSVQREGGLGLYVDLFLLILVTAIGAAFVTWLVFAVSFFRLVEQFYARVGAPERSEKDSNKDQQR